MTNKPPLSIAHLLLWTGMSGAVMGMIRYLAMRGDGGDWRPSGVEMAVLGVLAIYCGTVTSGVVIWIARRMRDIPFPTEPGEWLLVMQGLLAIVLLAADYVAEPVEALTIVVCLACVAVGWLPVLLSRTRDTWRNFFLWLAVLSTMPIVIHGLVLLDYVDAVRVMLILAFVGLVVVIAFLASAVSIDYKLNATHRGWLHWVGIGALVSLLAGAVFALFLPLFVR